MNEVLKTQLAHWLRDQYFAAMADNLLKVAQPGTTFAKFLAECISIFGTMLKKAAKTTVLTSVAENYSDKADQLLQLGNQCRKKKKEIKAQYEMIEWQKKEIENLKAASMQVYLQKMIEATTQGMACMYNTHKDPAKS